MKRQNRRVYLVAVMDDHSHFLVGYGLHASQSASLVIEVFRAAVGTAEREATIEMLDELQSTHDRKPITLGGDKWYDDGEFFRKLESRKIEPHIPLVGEPADPKSVKDRKRLPGIRARRRMKRRMKEVGYGLSRKCRKKVEECFGWLKSVAGLGRSRVVGRWKLVQLLQIGAAAFNLVRLRKLSPAT